MPFVPVANTALAEIRMIADLQEVENTLYFEKATALTEGDLNDLGDALITWWEDNMAPNIWAGVTVSEVVCTDLSSASSLQVSRVPAAPLTGALSVPGLPTSVSLTISFRTALRGRSFRGRNYIVGLTEGQTTGANTVDSSLSDAFVTAYEQLLTLAGDLGLQWVVVSRFSGVDADEKPIPRAAGVTTPITTVLVVDNVVDSQRRRLPGRGR